MQKSKWRHFKNKWLITLVIVILVIVAIVYVRGNNNKPTFETATASVTTISEKVSVTGTISPASKSNLSFKKGGVISNVYVKVGDMVKTGQPIVALDTTSDRAALSAAQATLADISRSLTQEELAVQKTALLSAEKDVVNAVHSGFSKTQSAVLIYTDTMFTNARSVNPTISIYIDGINNQNSINKKRLDVTYSLDLWSQDLLANPPIKPAILVSRVKTYLSTIKDFMSDLSVVVNNLNTTNSGTTQSAISSVITAMNNGLSNLNAAMTSITQAETALATTQSNYNLKISGNSAESIAAQAARVAEVQAQLEAGTIYSPIDGIVTRADPNVGEYIAPGQAGFAVQNRNFKIEARVPEADIAKIVIGNMASTTLDAYGSRVDFPAKVISIDPAETILEGVPTFKVTLTFLQNDDRIRSGMTANLEILTHEKTGVLAVPYRAIIDENGTRSVRIVNNDGTNWTVVPVKVGLKGSDGMIEIISGLKKNDKVVTYVK